MQASPNAIEHARPLRVRLLGGLQVVDGGGIDRTPRSRKARALAAYVLLADAPVPRERLATLLWGESGDEQAKASLRQALYELRALTSGQPPLLVVSRDHVAPNAAAFTTDLAELERLARERETGLLADALDRAATTLLDDLYDVSPEFDDWLTLERTRRIARLVGSAAAAGRASLPTSESIDAPRLADALERLDPLDEPVIRFGLLADHAVGDLAAVHRRYRRFRDRLAGELDATPSVETRRLFAELTSATDVRTVGVAVASDAPTTTAAHDATSSVPAPDAPVILASPAPGAIMSASTASELDVFAGPPPTARAAPPRRRVGAIVAATLLVIAGLVALAYFWPRSPAAAPSLAVLPFVELPSQRPDAYFASGVSDEIRRLLARDPKLRIVGAESADLLTVGADPRSVARRAGVSHLLEGSVDARGGRMRVDVRLVDAADGRTLWRERYERAVADVFAVQNEIAVSVAARLQGAYAPSGNRHLQTDPEVYDRHLAARALARERRVPALTESRRLLLEAIALDPEYAPAFASLSQVTMLLADHPSSYGTTPFVQAQDAARRHAERALALAPELGEAHAAIGLVSMSDALSLPHYERAVALDPQRADFHRWLGQSYAIVGRHADALREFRYAATLEPLWWLSYEHLVGHLIFLGRRDEAIAAAARYERLAADPFGRARVRAGLALRLGDFAGFLRSAQDAERNAPGERTGWRDLATAWAVLGERARALEALPASETIARLVLSDDVDGLAREALRLGPAFWYVAADSWDAAKTLVAGGRGDALLQVYDASFGSPEAYHERQRGASLGVGIAVAAALRDAGRNDEALALVRLLQGHLDVDAAAGVPADRLHALRASLHAVAGERDRGLDELERAYAAHWHHLAGVPFTRVDRDPAFRTFGDDPRLRRVTEGVIARLNEQRRAAGLPPQGTS